MYAIRSYYELLTQTSDIQAMFYPGRGTIVAGSDYTLILYKNGAYVTSKTCGTLGHKFCNAHEIFLPGVITSYSIHYTKLYDSGEICRSAVSLSERRKLAGPGAAAGPTRASEGRGRVSIPSKLTE